MLLCCQAHRAASRLPGIPEPLTHPAVNRPRPPRSGIHSFVSALGRSITSEWRRNVYSRSGRCARRAPGNNGWGFTIKIPFQGKVSGSREIQKWACILSSLHAIGIIHRESISIADKLG